MVDGSCFAMKVACSRERTRSGKGGGGSAMKSIDCFT